MAPTALDEPRLSGSSSLDGEPRRFGSGWGTGIEGSPVPEGYVRQTVYPFRAKRPNGMEDQ